MTAIVSAFTSCPDAVVDRSAGEVRRGERRAGRQSSADEHQRHAPRYGRSRLTR